MTTRRDATPNGASVYDLPALSFKAHHGRFGAWSTLTFGQWYAGGGIVQRTSKRPVPTDLPIEVAAHQAATEGRFPVCLPFTPSLPQQWTAYSAAQVSRTYKLATDSWQTPDFALRVRTPFARLASLDAPADELRLHLAPVTLVELEYDNRKGARDGYLYFGLGKGVRRVESSPNRKTLYGDGFALAIEDGRDLVRVARGRNIAARFNRSPQLELEAANQVAGETEDASGGFSLKIPKGEQATFSLVLAHYTNDSVVSDKANGAGDFRFYYTTLFPSLDAVVTYGLQNIAALRRMAEAADRMLETSALNDARRFIIAHGIRSYLGNTALLTDGTRTLFAELEGEYEFINTLDLIADHCFFTAEMFPFALKNQLDWYADHYSYVDQVKRYPSSELHAGGRSFTHDMGQPPALAAYGTSAYERPDIDPHRTPPGVRSFMTLEELCNWTLSAFVYYERTNDAAWLRSRRALLEELVTSFVNRDDYDARRRDGLPSLDSSKTGTGAEITTYDSLALDLALAVDSSYIAIKAWGSQVALARMLEAAGAKESAERATGHATLAAATLEKQWRGNFFPARFAAGNTGVALPTIEAVAHLMDDAAVMRDRRWQPLLRLLTQHGARAWDANRQARGVALANTDTQIWYSKLAINQAALERLTNRLMPEADDRRHAENIYTNGPDEPYGDNWDARSGQRRENVRNYPRGAAAWIWIEGTRRR